MVTILNHFGPNSRDKWLGSLLLQALKDILPELSGAELGFLVRLGPFTWSKLNGHQPHGPVPFAGSPTASYSSVLLAEGFCSLSSGCPWHIPKSGL